jgi:hypothetical protein
MQNTIRYSYPGHEYAAIHAEEAEATALLKISTLNRFEEIWAGQAIITDDAVATYSVYHCQVLIMRHLNKIGVAHILPNNHPEPFIEFMIAWMDIKNATSTKVKLVLGWHMTVAEACESKNIAPVNIQTLSILGKKDVIINPTDGMISIFTKKMNEITMRY